MSQSDFQVDSGNGFSVRADINAAIQALASNNAGPTEPPVKYAGMWWPDTTTGMMKQRNADNSAWIDRFPLNGTVFGYAAGSGGTVIQPTSKITTVTLNKLCGLITTHNASLAAGASAAFAVNNSMFQMGDVVVPMLQNGAQGDVMLVHVWAAVPGVFYLNLKNNSGDPQALAVDIYFTIIKGATS